MSSEEATTDLQFHEMGLDSRLVKAIAKLGWSSPTPIQEKGIPLILEGKDVIIRAKTGSGKTASYAIPLIQKILTSIHTDQSPFVHALVILPSKELSYQATTNIKELCAYCSRDIKVVGVSHTLSVSSQRATLLESPHVVVGTPSRILSHLSGKSLIIDDSLQLVVFDEADLLFSYGYEEDIKNIISYLPSVYQTVLMSATLTEEVLTLKKLVLHHPVTLKLEEPDLPEDDRLTQYHIKCNEEDKFLLIYTLLKLKLVRGKSLIFVNDITRCYRLKLFLEQFSIKSCVLNSELPHNSRCHAVDEFNRGIYDYIIATDELPETQTKSKGLKKRKRSRDKEYGVSRGIDFKGVENVINFDFPPTSDAYIHRVGRTARGFDYGTALMFVSHDQESQLADLEEKLKERRGHPVSPEATIVRPYRFKMSEIEGFRYRVQDACKNVSAMAIKEARLKELRAEMLSSNKLKDHFEDNPRDLQVLRHDRVLLPHRIKEHLMYIPPYLVPKVLRDRSASKATAAAVGTVTECSHDVPKSGKKRVQRPFMSKRRNDPLKSFKVKVGTKRHNNEPNEVTCSKKSKTV